MQMPAAVSGAPTKSDPRQLVKFSEHLRIHAATPRRLPVHSSNAATGLGRLMADCVEKLAGAHALTARGELPDPRLRHSGARGAPDHFIQLPA